MAGDVYRFGTQAGGLTAQAAAWTGLRPGTAVAIGHADAHAAVPAAGVSEAGRMVIIMGTSNCHMLLSEQEHIVPGMCGYVEDGIIPGFFGYEAGQACVGDHFAWFMENCVPASYAAEAERAASACTNSSRRRRRRSSRVNPGWWRWIGGTATAACWSMSISPA
jgi:L-ribulokinase